MSKYKLSEKLHDQIFNSIKGEIIADSVPSKNPSIIITGGQPGSGLGKGA